MIGRGAALVAAVLVAGCSAVGTPDLLGGRERCWDHQRDPRAAASLEGTLELDQGRSVLDTVDTEFDLSFPSLAVRTDSASGRLAIIGPQGVALAADGDKVTLFGGMGSDGYFTVCSVEERHDG